MIDIVVGVDLVSIERFTKLLNRFDGAFKKQIFTHDELDYCGDSIQRLASRFAAKEATSKALQVGLAHMSGQGVPATDIEVRNQTNGVPFLNLSGLAAEIVQQQQIQTLKLSISHESQHVIAMVTGLRLIS